MYGGQQPIFILKEGTDRTSGRSAQSNNIAAAKAVADAVRSTLGPKGMDKMLVDSMGDVVITNDGATILKEMDIEHPAAKMIIEIPLPIPRSVICSPNHIRNIVPVTSVTDAVKTNEGPGLITIP